jgi:hypothetical protein
MKHILNSYIEVAPSGSSRGSYSPLLDRITVDPQLLPTGNVPLTVKQRDDLWSTLLHETTHAIQSREGFARGGSPGEFYPKNYDD